MSFVLVATVGSTDVQVVLERDGKTVRVPVLSGVRGFHQALLDDDSGYEIVDERDSVPKGGSPDFQPRRENGMWIFRDGDREQSCERLRIALPKIRPLTAAILAGKAGLKEETLMGALVISTHRTGPSEKTWYSQEPIAAAPLVAHWIASQFRLKRRDGSAEILAKPGCVDILHLLVGEEETQWDADDAVLGRAVARMTVAIRSLAKVAPQIAIADGGGPSRLKEPLLACAQFYFGTDNTRIAPPSGRGSWPVAAPTTPGPSESFRARTTIRVLIHEGDFGGAAAIARPFRKAGAAPAWARTLGLVDKLFGGTLREDMVRQGTEFAWLRSFLVGSARYCLLPALRVEAALWSGRLVEAINRTCSFLDAALVDQVMLRIGATEIYPSTRQMRVSNSDQLDDWLFEERDFAGRAYACLKRVDNAADMVRYDMMGGAKDDWIRFLERPALQAVQGALRKGVKIRNTVVSARDIRNDDAHRSTNDPAIEAVAQWMQEQKIWNRQTRQSRPGDLFLGSPKVQAVLAGVREDETNPYRQIIERIEDDLLQG